MTWNSFIARWKGHCYCPTSPPSYRGASTAWGDYGRRKKPLNRFCFVFFFIFSSPPVCTVAPVWKGEIMHKWDCCLSVAPRYWHATTSKGAVALWSSLKRDTCFFTCCNNCSACWYSTPRWMTGLDRSNMAISVGHKILISNDTAQGRRSGTANDKLQRQVANWPSCSSNKCSAAHCDLILE